MVISTLAVDAEYVLAALNASVPEPVLSNVVALVVKMPVKVNVAVLFCTPMAALASGFTLPEFNEMLPG